MNAVRLITIFNFPFPLFGNQEMHNQKVHIAVSLRDMRDSQETSFFILEANGSDIRFRKKVKR